MWQGILGIFLFIAVAVAFSENRKAFPVKGVFVGVILQFVIAVLMLKMPFFREVFLLLNKLVVMIDQATTAGTSFVFGYLGGGTLPFDEKFPGASFILAFKALPLVLLVSALSSLLFYWRILPVVVRGFSILFKRTMGLGGAEALGVSANIFVGMVEAPLIIRPYFEKMGRSEIFALMTCGMATIAGTVMILYANILKAVFSDPLGHILTASIISAPAAIVIAKVMVPGGEKTETGALKHPDDAHGAMDAVTKGTMHGVKLLINIIAMLVVLVALVHLVNLILGLIPVGGEKPLTLQQIMGAVMAPVVWCMGVPWSEAMTAGSLMGVKTVLNELLAYLKLANLPSGALSEKSRIIMLYALCGFANPGSLGIMIGGLGAMAPGRRNEVVGLGLRSILAGTLATCMTGAVVGLIL